MRVQGEDATTVTERQSQDSRDPAWDPRLNIGVPHVARVYDYWLGGKDNFAADRVAGEETIERFPGIRLSAQANRAFLRRAVRYLAGQAGIRQFLDIGTGLPAASNTHEVAQAVAPESRVVYVDNDPLVLAHARALLTSRPEGATAYLDADLRDTGHDPRAGGRRPWTSPARSRIMLLAILHYIPDLAEARRIVAAADRTPCPRAASWSSPTRAPTCCPMTWPRSRRALTRISRPTTTTSPARATWSTGFFDGRRPGGARPGPGQRLAPGFAARKPPSPTILWGGVARKR